MARSRVQFQTILETILGTDHVYFQPPESVKMKYPAIVYSVNDLDKKEADNLVYLKHHIYRVVYIDMLPVSPVLEKLENMVNSKYINSYVSDNLNHTTFEIYY